MRRSKEVYMKIDEILDYVATSNQENDNYYTLMHSFMLTRKREKNLLRSRGSYLHKLLEIDKVPSKRFWRDITFKPY